MNLKHALWVACALIVAPIDGAAQEAPSSKWVAVSAADAGVRATDLLKLPRVTAVLEAGQSVRVLAIGSSSTVGMGASSPANTFPARLEIELEDALDGRDFIMVSSGRNGEQAEGAAARLRKEVLETKPDLLIWQVGTNDGIHKVDPQKFRKCVTETLAWIKAQGVDVVLVNPQYGKELMQNPHYEKIVTVVSDVARETQTLMFDRFNSTRALAFAHGENFYMGPDKLHLNDEGYRGWALEMAKKTIIPAIYRALKKPLPRIDAAREKGGWLQFDY